MPGRDWKGHLRQVTMFTQTALVFLSLLGDCMPCKSRACFLLFTVISPVEPSSWVRRWKSCSDPKIPIIQWESVEKHSLVVKISQGLKKNCVVSVQRMRIRGHLLNIYCGPTLGLLPKGFIQRQRIGSIVLWRHRRTLQLKNNHRGLVHHLQTEMPASLN